MGCVNSNPKPKNQPLPTNSNNTAGALNPPPQVGTLGNVANGQNNSGINNTGAIMGYAAQQYQNVPIGGSQIRDSNQPNPYPHQSPSKLSHLEAQSVNASAMKGLDLPEVTQKTQMNATNLPPPHSNLLNSGEKPYQSVFGNNRKLGLDNDGFVPEDSVMDYGQSTIEDLNKVEVNFHV